MYGCMYVVSMPSPAEICKGKLKQESQGLPGNKKQGPVDSLTGPDGVSGCGHAMGGIAVLSQRPVNVVADCI